MSVFHVEHAERDDEDDNTDLEPDKRGLHTGRAAHAAGEDERDQQAQQECEQVDHAARLIRVAARCPEHPLGQGNPELFDKEAEIAGDADADHGDNRCVLQQQIPADEPTDTLAQDDVTVGVCRPGLRDHAGELRVRQRGAGAGDASDQKRQEHPWPGLLVRHRSGEREDTGADDAAYPDRGELPQPQHTLQPTAFMQIFRLDFVDRLTSEDAPRRGAEECHAARPFDCEPGSRSILVTCLTLARCRRLLDQLLLLFRAAAAKASMDGNSRA